MSTSPISEASLSLTVRFFASLREQLGQDEITLEKPGPVKVSDVWAEVTDQAPPDNLLCSRNLQYANWDENVEDGDEIAFFPPVTGG